MDKEGTNPTLSESWQMVRDQRKQMDAQVAELSTREVAEFIDCARHIIEVLEELRAVAKHDRLARLEDELKRFVWAAGRATEAAEQLQLLLARTEVTPLASMEPVGGSETVRETKPAVNGADSDHTR